MMIDDDHATALIVEVYAKEAARVMSMIADYAELPATLLHDLVGEELTRLAEGG